MPYNDYRRNLRTSAMTLTVTALLVGALPLSAQVTSGPDIFTRTVAVGDSLSAGYQNFSLFDSNTIPVPVGVQPPPGGQRTGFAVVVAHQAGHDLTLPLFAYPGVPANFFVYPGAPFGRENPTQQTTNLSVPGFTLANALANPFPGDPTDGIDLMSAMILGLPGTIPGCGPIPTGRTHVVSELTCAIALKPTALLVSIGSNDALQALTLGITPTDPRIFALQYAAFVGGLASTGAKVTVTNIGDVTAIPYLVPVPAYAARCPGGVLPAGATASDFVVADISKLPVDPCANPILRKAAIVNQARNAVVAYNQTIAAVGRAVGAAVVDVNALFAGLRNTGYPVTIGTKSKTLTTAFGGGLFSLDGMHPTNTGYAILANATIAAIKSKFGTSITPVNINAVAATDPLVP